MAQHGQILKLQSRRPDGKPVWAYRYRVNGGCSKRPQVGGFATREAAELELRRRLERLGPGAEMTLAELVAEYLEGHQAAPLTLEKLHWLLVLPAASRARRRSPPHAQVRKRHLAEPGGRLPDIVSRQRRPCGRFSTPPSPGG